MLKHFRVPGRLAVKLEELGVSVSASASQGGSSARPLPANPSACLHRRAFCTLARNRPGEL